MEEDEITLQKVQGALEKLKELYLDRRIKELRMQMDEAQKRGDDAMVLTLAQEKIRLDRERQR
jgi:uncharacterized membrane protein (DUF106 family)